jgi:restriction system protein
VTDRVHIPRYTDLLWPTLCTVREIGDSGTIEEIVERTIAREGFTEEQQAVPANNGRQSLLEHRLAWCRSYLKGMGLLENSQRAVWSTTELGRSVKESEIPALYATYTAELSATRRLKRAAASEDEQPEEPSQAGQQPDGRGDWKSTLLATVQAMAPDSFERLARRLLREAGFASVTVTGKAGDGGIDGTGVYRLSLVSFPVFFQCKRYIGSVGAGAVRDFRGAMSGRGDYGLLITTGTFTTEAKREATRDGAPTVDLIDGDRLCDLLKQYELGVSCRIREVEDVEIMPDFFQDL